jgi:glycosyltransferase involved in cell wall biosynthesis
MYEGHDWLIVANPFPYIGGAEKRIFEVLKHFNSFGIRPILHIPYTNLLFSMTLGKMNKNVYDMKNILKELEHSHVVVPSIYYEYIEEKFANNIDEKMNSPFRKGIFGALRSLKDSINSFRIGALNILHLNFFLRDLKLNNIDFKSIDLVYSMQEHSDTVALGAFLAKALHKNFYTLLQLEPFGSFKNLITRDYTFRVIFCKESITKEFSRLFILTLSSLFRNPKAAYEYANRLKVLKGILSVSQSPLIISGLDSWANRRGIPVKILKPANSVNEKLAKYAIEKNRRSLMNKKEDFAIYYARLNASKGLFEIPYIAKKLSNAGYKLVIAGRFDNLRDKDRFFKICKEKEVKNIEYVGYLPEDRLYDLISRAKVLIYPSHSDSFSFVILEALFLGCFVVAYDIPAIKSVYSGLRPIKIVKEYDCHNMAEISLRILKMNTSQCEEEHLDTVFLNFLKIHSSWKNVAKAEIEAILEMVNSKTV